MAEGVETPQEAAFLRAHGCDQAQGYHFGRPLPPQQFAELLRSGIAGPADVASPGQASSVLELPDVSRRKFRAG